MRKSKDAFSLPRLHSNRCECKVCGLVFVASIHAFTPRPEMGVSHQMLGVKSPFRFGVDLESLACV